MQNRGALWVFTILLALACLWQLSFSFFTGGLEKKAKGFAEMQLDSALQAPSNVGRDTSVVRLDLENKYIRDHYEDKVYPVFGYSYKECKEKEINLGLDLKGGMAVTLEVSIPELVEKLGNESKDPAFVAAIAEARKRQVNNGGKDFITLFDEEFRKAAPSGSLAAIFSTQDNTSIFPRTSTNEQIIDALRKQADVALGNTERILRTRIDKFGVSQPSIQKQTLSGRIAIELPGVKDKERVRKVLQSTANLEFWETFDSQEMVPVLVDCNTKLGAIMRPDLAAGDSAKLVAKKLKLHTDSLLTTRIDSLRRDSTNKASAMLADSLANVMANDTTGNAVDSTETEAELRAKNPLFSRLQVNQQRGEVIGYCAIQDTAEVMRMLRMVPVASPNPSLGVKLAWGNTPMGQALSLHALKVPRGGKPKLDGNVIVDANYDYDVKGDPEVVMQMNSDGAQVWKRMTGENVGKYVAIVLDGYVMSAPVVMGEIPGGRSSISMGGGDKNKQLENATDLANVLKAGALPAPARIIDETVVGPSLGAENIKQGLISFVVAMLVVMLFMVIYYNGSGWIANVALLANIFVLMGTLASLQASLTLAGIAGIVLTVGMAVDANVLINERIREELRHGKMLKSAVDLGYKHAMSAIIDANVTHFVVAVILIFFGSGPVKSFGVTLALGILTSLFTAIFISRLIITRRLEKGKTVSFWHRWNKDVFVGANYGFMSKRKYFYFFSGAIIIAGFVSMFTQGFSLGVDFSGGREYVVHFEQPADVEQVRAGVEKVMVNADGTHNAPKVVTYGGDRRLKITTNYLVNEQDTAADRRVEEKLKEGLAGFKAQFPIEESRKVDPTISDDIRTHAWYAVGFALLFIFLYVAVRFRTWQFGLGALLSLAHDALVVVGLYSLLHRFMPFALEVNEDFIAAILTVIGYSINDTVVVFDRIREYLQDHKRDPWAVVFNKAINSTLGRTINTSVTVLIVLLVIFLFGAESIKGFVFAMLVGIGVGTYSSIFIASAVVVDLHKDGVPEKAPAVPVTA